MSMSPSDSLIASQFAELMMLNENLAIENRLFDSFIRRTQHQNAISSSQSSNSNANNDDSKTPKSSTGRRGTSRQQHEPTLTDYDKHRLALSEHAYRRSQLSALDSKARSDVNLLRAITAGIKIRINELRKETYEFQRDIVVGGENTRTGKIMAEKVIRYFEEKLKQKAALVDKMKLKNKAYKIQLQKMDSTVKHKEEQGDSLKPIDYHQLRIKNSQFNQKIKDCNDDLLKLKQTTGKTVQELNTQKRALNTLMSLSRKLRGDLKSGEIARVKLTGELAKVEEEVRREKAKNKKYKIQQSNPDMPQVMDYVNQKSAMYDLESAVHNWERKIEIIEMAAKRARIIIREEEEINRRQQQQQQQQQQSQSQRYGSMLPPQSAPNNNNNNNSNSQKQLRTQYSKSLSASGSHTLPRIR